MRPIGHPDLKAEAEVWRGWGTSLPQVAQAMQSGAWDSNCKARSFSTWQCCLLGSGDAHSLEVLVMDTSCDGECLPAQVPCPPRQGRLCSLWTASPSQQAVRASWRSHPVCPSCGQNQRGQCGDLCLDNAKFNCLLPELGECRVNKRQCWVSHPSFLPSKAARVTKSVN